MKIFHFPDKLGDTPGPQGQVEGEEGERVVEPVHQRHHVQPKVTISLRKIASKGMILIEEGIEK
jgi:hypothetical protein